VDKKGLTFKVHVMGLAATVMVAREELQRAEWFALAVVTRDSGPSLLALTILSSLTADALPVLRRIGYFPGP
jgi:hypothetical protein